jgi:ATP-dependent Lon protease
MNPVLFFDELDKVSSSDKGDEIINTLIHLTDPTQNKNFTDRYFEEIELDLSKSIIIFTYNNENLINPILKDRIITINVNGYTLKEKIIISKDYLIKEIMQEYNIAQTDVIFSDNIIKYIIENTNEEEGVRNLKRNINNIISWINVMRYIPHNDVKLKFPFDINTDFVDKFIKKYNKSFIKDVHHSMYT